MKQNQIKPDNIDKFNQTNWQIKPNQTELDN